MKQVRKKHSSPSRARAILAFLARILWVAHASVVSQVIRADTNATAIMTGERVADWIKGSR